MRVCHRHGDTYLYHVMSTKMSPPRVTGYMPASVPLVVTGRPAAKGAACSERDGVIVPRKRQWPDAGMYPVTRGGLILVTKM